MKEHKRDEINQDTVRDIYNKNSYCIYCGRKVKLRKRHIDYSVEHIFPRAIFKWTKTFDKATMNAKCNLAITHPKCNMKKSAYVPTHSYLDGLCTTPNHIKALHEYREQNKDLIKAYLDMLNEVHADQDCKCAICKKDLKRYNAILRRIDFSKPRVIENAMAVCNACSIELIRSE